ncbi:MAG: type III-A CRISPR-associated protein Cas10/Csm1 [Desulfobacterales bacterium]
MAVNVHELVLGALLHDIGKFVQRAFGSTKELPWKNYDMESTLCPTDKHQRYTHRHVLFTSAFFDLMKEKAVRFPEGVDIDRVAEIASFHHRPESASNPSLAWMVALADRYSSGMDRRSEEEGTGEGRSREAYRRLPLRCIFDEVIISDREKPVKPHAYRLAPLDPFSEETLVPVPWEGERASLPNDYARLWAGFEKDYLRLTSSEAELSPVLFEECLLGLLERYAWAIPSSTIDIPDISLFDHMRTTAAIAVCLYRFHEERDELQDLRAINDENHPKFRFLAGDLSGIQSTLFTLEHQGVKSVNKILRARSFMLAAIVESGAIQAVNAMKLPRSCIVQQAGGRFLILTPDTPGTPAVVENLRKKFDSWLLNNYSGSLALNLALSDPFAGEEFKNDGFQSVYQQLLKAVEEAKQRPLSSCRQGVIRQEVPFDRSCSACGNRPAQGGEDREFRCNTCDREARVGGKLPRAALYAWAPGNLSVAKSEDVLGLRLLLCASGEALGDNKRFLSIRSLNPKGREFFWAPRMIANYVPRFEQAAQANEPRYAGLAEEDFQAEENALKTFGHIGAEALEAEDDGRTFKGKPFLAVLKADVDRLGYIFSHGLRRKEKDSRFTLSRLAQLSRMIDLYFAGYLQGLLKREFPDTYTVYAGGDDLLFIGPWRQSLSLALRIEETFRNYTGSSPHITISAGLSIIHPNHPINRAVDEAEKRLDNAKAAGRNCITALISRPMTWQRYKERLAEAEWVNTQLNGPEPVSTGFVYRILEIAADVEAVDAGDTRRAGWRAKLAYHLARNIRGKTNEEKNARIGEWLKRLGLDNMLRLTRGQSSLSDWRLPISIALYRNR